MQGTSTYHTNIVYVRLKKTCIVANHSKVHGKHNLKKKNYYYV